VYGFVDAAHSTAAQRQIEPIVFDFVGDEVWGSAFNAFHNGKGLFVNQTVDGVAIVAFIAMTIQQVQVRLDVLDLEMLAAFLFTLEQIPHEHSISNSLDATPLPAFNNPYPRRLIRFSRNAITQSNFWLFLIPPVGFISNP
jgi:hypothetical protein